MKKPSQFRVEYEIPPLRAIYWKEVDVDTFKEAKEFIINTVPFARIRAVHVTVKAPLQNGEA